MTEKTKRRYDPDRRERILNATLDVIATHGVAGTTHRRVAEVADVPLGAMTYYFQGLEALLEEAFTHFATALSRELEATIASATTKDQARDIIISWACDEFCTSERNLVLIFEHFAYAARVPQARPLLSRWMSVTESYLIHHFGRPTAKILDAFIDGVVMHNVVTPNHISREEVAEFIHKLTA